jgi:hypothetical protein
MREVCPPSQATMVRDRAWPCSAPPRLTVSAQGLVRGIVARVVAPADECIPKWELQRVRWMRPLRLDHVRLASDAIRHAVVAEVPPGR